MHSWLSAFHLGCLCFDHLIAICNDSFLNQQASTTLAMSLAVSRKIFQSNPHLTPTLLACFLPSCLSFFEPLFVRLCVCFARMHEHDVRADPILTLTHSLMHVRILDLITEGKIEWDLMGTTKHDIPKVLERTQPMPALASPQLHSQLHTHTHTQRKRQAHAHKHTQPPPNTHTHTRLHITWAGVR